MYLVQDIELYMDDELPLETNQMHDKCLYRLGNHNLIVPNALCE